MTNTAGGYGTGVRVPRHLEALRRARASSPQHASWPMLAASFRTAHMASLSPARLPPAPSSRPPAPPPPPASPGTPRPRSAGLPAAPPRRARGRHAATCHAAGRGCRAPQRRAPRGGRRRGPAAARPRVRSHSRFRKIPLQNSRFRNKGANFLSESGMKWLNSATKAATRPSPHATLCTFRGATKALIPAS
jgi:hypothetical protein